MVGCPSPWFPLPRIQCPAANCRPEAVDSPSDALPEGQERPKATSRACVSHSLPETFHHLPLSQDKGEYRTERYSERETLH